MEAMQDPVRHGRQYDAGHRDHDEAAVVRHSISFAITEEF
jgi:hypothetical protein